MSTMVMARVAEIAAIVVLPAVLLRPLPTGAAQTPSTMVLRDGGRSNGAGLTTVADAARHALAAMALSAGADSQVSGATAPKPLDPVLAITDAFESHDIVALDEGSHRNEQAHQLRLKLIRHPSFARRVNDIVVEFGSARYQDVMDRYVRGENVPADELRHAWQDTTQFAVWDVPIYQDFFRAVREINTTLAANRRLRVLLADPPIDWAAVKTPADHFTWLRARDTHGAELIQREVLAKKRKALLIFGGRHLQRKNISANYESLDGAETVISILHAAGAAKIFTIWTATNPEPQSLQADMSTWPVPSLALLRGTRLGLLDFAAFLPPEEARFGIVDGKPSPLPRDQFRVRPMQEQFDALLYLGPLSTITTAKLPASLCADAAYRQMRRGRMLLLNQKAQADQLDRECGTSPPAK